MQKVNVNSVFFLLYEYTNEATYGFVFQISLNLSSPTYLLMVFQLFPLQFNYILYCQQLFRWSFPQMAMAI